MDTALTPRRLALAAAGASALLLAGAWAFQLAGYAPCALCLIQRWPHYAAVLIGAVILVAGPHGALRLAGLVAMIVAAGLALHHSGVEWGLWPGPAACAPPPTDLSGLSPQALREAILLKPVIRCDQPALVVLGVTMANANALASAALALVWGRSLRR